MQLLILNKNTNFTSKHLSPSMFAAKLTFQVCRAQPINVRSGVTPDPKSAFLFRVQF